MVLMLGPFTPLAKGSWKGLIVAVETPNRSLKFVDVEVLDLFPHFAGGKKTAYPSLNQRFEVCSIRKKGPRD